MTLFQADAAPQQTAVGPGAKEIYKLFQGVKNPPLDHPAGTSGTSTASQVGLWSLSFY